MSASRKHFLVVWLAVMVPTTAVLVLSVYRDLWLWAVLISAGLSVLSAFVLISNMPRIIKVLYISGYIFAIGVGALSSFPPVTIPISGAYMGLLMAAIGVLAHRWLTGKWLAFVMIVSGAGIGLVYYVLLGSVIAFPRTLEDLLDEMKWYWEVPQQWALVYYIAVAVLAAYAGNRMLATPRSMATAIEPTAAAQTTVVSADTSKRGVNVTALILGILSVTICAGMAAALGISNLVGKGLFANWESLGSPTASAGQIVNASSGGVILRAQDGNNYRLTLGYKSKGTAWEHVANEWSIEMYGCERLESASQKQDLQESYSLLSVPPNVTVEPYVLKCLAPESTWVIVYVVNQEGEVLRWQSPEGFEALGQALKWGLLGGIVVGLALAAVLILRRSRSKTR